MSAELPGTDEELRRQALTRLKKKRDFTAHVFTYLVVNSLLVGIWAISSGTDSFFWPVFPMIGWGVGLAFNAWDVYGRKPISEQEVRREMDRLRR